MVDPGKGLKNFFLQTPSPLIFSRSATGIHSNPANGNHFCMQPPTGTVTLKKFSVKCSPEPILTNAQTQKGGGGRAVGARIRKDLL